MGFAPEESMPESIPEKSSMPHGEKTTSGFSEIIFVLQADQESEDGSGEPAEKREQENQQHGAAYA